MSNPYSAPTSMPSAPPPAPGIVPLLFSFDGRIPRRYYWAAGIGVGVLSGILGAAIGAAMDKSAVGSILIVAVNILSIWIGLAVQIKRWHDRDKAGWWVLINFIPIIGWIWSLFELGCLRGTLGSNKYGPDPT